MHTLAAYSLEAALAPGAAVDRLKAVEHEITEWLTKKGVVDPSAARGSFDSQTGADGAFTRSETSCAAGQLLEVQLVETAHTGQTFTTTIQAAYDKTQVTVFATLAVSSVSTVVAPVRIYPRCPHVIRNLVNAYSDWTFGNQQVPTSVAADTRGVAGGTELCKELLNPARNFPIVVVSADPDEVVWPSLPQEMARELVALAQVAVVDEEASWTMTNELGKQQSCFLGAVRLYWPIPRAGVSPRGPIWTASRQSLFGPDSAGLKRYLSTVRRTVMSAAALTVTPPRVLREIQGAITRDRLKSLEAAARDKELDSIIEENASLAQRLEAANQEIAALRWKVTHLRERLQGDEEEDQDEDSPGTDESPPVHVPPGDNEVRYYKKIGNKGGVDILVPTASCNHKESSWRRAFKGDQAEKGLAKLEGRSDWKSLEHCGACTGGGRWRASW